MSTEKTTTIAEAVRNLIVCDTQFGWNGETTLKLPELLDLQARGWLIEGDENNEFSLTVEGEAVVAQALQLAAPTELAEQQGVGITADWVLGYFCTDAPEDSREAVRNAFTEWDALAATGKQQVGAPLAAPGVGEWSRGWNACREAMLRGDVACGTCNGWGLIGGPSFYAPDEGGVPCPDCSSREQVGEVQGDARLLADVDERINTAKALGYEDDIGVGIGLLQCVRAALAARQPGAQEELHGFLKNSTPLREAALRALGFIDRSDEHGRTAYDCLRRELHAECAAPPAQGIDLGVTEEEREWIDYAIAHMRDDSEPEDLTCADALEQLLRRVDGQRDAAPGVGNG